MVKHIWARQNQARLNRFSHAREKIYASQFLSFFFFFAKHLMGFVSWNISRGSDARLAGQIRPKRERAQVVGVERRRSQVGGGDDVLIPWPRQLIVSPLPSSTPRGRRHGPLLFVFFFNICLLLSHFILNTKLCTKIWAIYLKIVVLAIHYVLNWCLQLISDNLKNLSVALLSNNQICHHRLNVMVKLKEQSFPFPFSPFKQAKKKKK